MQMAELSQGEKLQVLVREVMRNKITSDFTQATKIAESLMAEDSRLSEGERYFKQVIFNKVTDDLLKWFAGNSLDKEIEKLHGEIEALRHEIAEVRKIAVQAAERKTVKRVIEVEEDAETGEVISQQPSQQHTGHNSMPSTAPQLAPKAEEPKKANVGAGANRAEMDPSEYDISKVFYFGNKK